MNEFKIIVVMNEAMIKFLKEKNMDCSLNEKIQKKLQDKALFFKISKINAHKILKAVGVKEENFEKVYKKLTSSDIFYELVQKGKVGYNDENLIIKYNDYRI